MQLDPTFNDDSRKLEGLIWSYSSIENAKMESNFDFDAVLFRPQQSKDKGRGQYQAPLLQRGEEFAWGKWRMHQKSFQKVEELSHSVLNKIRGDLKTFDPTQLNMLDKQITNLITALDKAKVGLEGFKQDFKEPSHVSEFNKTIDEFVRQAEADVIKTQAEIRERISVTIPVEKLPPKPPLRSAPKAPIKPPAPPPRSHGKEPIAPKISLPPSKKPPPPPIREGNVLQTPPKRPPRSNIPNTKKEPILPTASSPHPPTTTVGRPAVSKPVPRILRRSQAPTQISPIRPLPIPGIKSAKPAAVSVENKQLKNFDDIELYFWELHFSDKNFHNILEMAMTNATDPDLAANFIVSNFMEHIKSSGTSVIITPSNIEDLKRSFAAQMIFDKEVGADVSNEDPGIKPLRGGGALVIYQTIGDGTCALHALVGTQADGWFRCDGPTERAAFCDWLRQKRLEGLLPNSIKTVLEDYFLHFDLAPGSFRNATAYVYDQYSADYADLNLIDQNTRVQMFVEDDDVFEAYLRNLQKVGTYMLQPELFAAGEFYNLSIHLYQPGWGKFAHIVAEDLRHPGEGAVPGREVVHIWYNGFNHYERAIRT